MTTGCRWPRMRLHSRGEAPVAQRIEHLTTDQKVWGSNPYGRARQVAPRSGLFGFSGALGQGATETPLG